MSNLVRTSSKRGPLLKTKQWHDRAPLCSEYHLSMQALPASNKAGHWDKKACRWRKMFLHRSFLEPKGNLVRASHRNCRMDSHGSNLPRRSRVKIPSFRRAYQATSFSQRENETSKLPATKSPKSLEDKLSCQIRPHLS
jgi:hypothetical protein